MNNKTDIIKDFEETRKLCSPIYKPVINISQYFKNRLQNPDCYYNAYIMKNYFDGYYFDMNCFSDIVFTHQDTYRLLNSNIFEPFNPYNVTLLSATLSKITDITNKYFADKRIYIPGSLSINENYYYISRGNGKSLRELLSFSETFTDYSSSAKFTPYPYVYSLLPYSKEYKVHNYKIDMKNLYSEIIYKKLISSHLTNNSHKQRNNIQEEISCLKIIADKNNTIRKFHK